MTKAMKGLQDLIEEAKLRTVWWILFIYALTYFLTHTSKSIFMNIPIAVLLVSGLRLLVNEVEIRWKVRNTRSTSYLSYLEKKQLSVNDSRLSTLPPPHKWKRKIDSPVVEAAIEDFINKLLQDFVVDLWYSSITPDKEAPELIRAVIMDVLGEVSERIRDVNLVDLLTKDVIDLIGDHIDLFRRNQTAIGRDVMGTLSSEERDERLKHHLLASRELHPALISSDCEYKVLQRLMGGLLAAVLRPRESQCPLVRCIARELLTSLVMQPIMNFASPEYINELIESIILAYNDEGFKDVSADQSPNVEGNKHDRTVSGKRGTNSESNLRKSTPFINQETDLNLSEFEHKRKHEYSASGNHLSSTMEGELVHPRAAEWAKMFDAASQRRTEVLMPENLENMWTIGRNYKKKLQKRNAPGHQASEISDSVSTSSLRKDVVVESPAPKPVTSTRGEDKASIQLSPRAHQDIQSTNLNIDALSSLQDHYEEEFSKIGSTIYELENSAIISRENRSKLKRSNSTSDLGVRSNPELSFSSIGSPPIINEYYSAEINKHNAHSLEGNSDMVLSTEGLHITKLKCRVIGAYFEKLGSKSFAVYSIVVTGADNQTWFVKRRYRNFERLHRHLKEIPNYTLHLPPKRIFSSSTEDSFVHQRCIQLDKYLQDLLSIPNLAEQHEVWDFLSASSKNYSFGKSSSVMKTLAVNVDDAVDDIVRQFKGVSDGLMRAVVGPPSPCHDPASTVTSRNLSLNPDDMYKLSIRQSASESMNSLSENEEGDKDANLGQEDVSAAQANGWHSDSDLASKGHPPRVVKRGEDVSMDIEEMHSLRLKSDYPESSLALASVPQDDPTGVPPEWTPPNLSVPVLNLVDNIFQLNRRGWLRRQVFWISKQILQLVMEDAIDDWLLRQIQWLRREDIIALGIRWVQDILWPGGTFFIKLRIQDQLNNFQGNQRSQPTTRQPGGRRVLQPGSFEQQLEAARRASDVKKIIFNGAPATLVSLIGHKQYRRCARDIYYFLQSTICLKQLGYGILELVLVSVFPELRDLVKDIHEKMHTPHPV